MTISRIGQLFSATNIDRATLSPKEHKEEGAIEERSPSPSREAAVVAESVKRAHQALSQSDVQARQERVSKLKDAVRNGSYKVDTARVATALWRDLA
jgi:flagellar biosynthesis anti-sigma factor FlgM